MRPDPATDPLIGQMVGGRYVLARRIGKGGMGVVYEADHTALGKRVAVKLLLDKYTDDPEVVARFHREARTASAVGDDHIVEVTDAGVHDDGRSYLVMELLEGASLAEVIDATGPMPAARAVTIIRQVLRGLAAAHAKGIVHRDMKPENVFLVNKGDKVDFVKIMDFGISKFMAATESKVRLTTTGAVMGTPVYMAPEQALGQGEIDARVDLYAVGVMLYEMLAGKPPFQAPNYIALVTQHLHVPPPPLGLARPDLPPALLRAVHVALEKDPARRFRDAHAMAQALPAGDELWNHDKVPTLGSSTAWQSAVGSASLPVLTPDASASAAMTSAMNLRAMGAPRPTAPRRRWPLAVAALATAVVIAAAAVIVASGGGAGDGGGAAAAGEIGSAALPAPEDPPPQPPPAVAAPADPAADTSELEILSTPGGAMVSIDGVEHGRTPIVIARLAPGIHEVKIVKDDFAPVVLNKSVRAGRDETVSVMLARPTADGAGSAGTATTVVRPRTGGDKRPGSTVVTNKRPPADKPPDKSPGDKLPADKPPAEKPPGDRTPRDPYGDDPPATRPGSGSPDKKKNPYD